MVVLKKHLHDDYNKYILTSYDIRKSINGKSLECIKSATSLWRARNEIKNIIKYNLSDKSVFVTLTYAENIIDYKKCRTDLNVFIKRLNRVFKVEYICIKELQKRGAIHFHIIIFNDMKLDYSRFWHNGFIYVKPIIFDYDDIGKISNYMAKYLSKKGIAGNKKVYSTSRNLIRVKPINVNLNEMPEIIEKASITVEDINHHYFILKKSCLIENNTWSVLAKKW